MIADLQPQARPGADEVFYQKCRFVWRKKGGGYVRSVCGHYEHDLLHHVVWVEHHGEIIPGHRIIFKDGNKRNWDISNLASVPRSAPISVPENDLTEAQRLELAESMRTYIEGVALRYAAMLSQDVSELRHIGFVQAYRSAMRFQPEGGATFFGYAKLEVRNSIRDHSKKFSQVVNVPLARFGSAHCISIQAPLGDERDSATFEEYFLGEEETVTTEVDHRQLKEALVELIEALPEDDREVIRGRFFEGKTLREVADDIGLTHQNVGYIEKRALAALRRSKLFREVSL